jgi:hypothetical protein
MPQWPNGHPAEVKASAVLRSNPTDKAANAANDRQEAEGLEKNDYKQRKLHRYVSAHQAIRPVKV